MTQPTDFREFLEEMRPLTSTWYALRRHGLDLSYNTVLKWKDRNSVPSSRWTALLRVAKEQNKQVTYEDFVKFKNRALSQEENKKSNRNLDVRE